MEPPAPSGTVHAPGAVAPGVRVLAPTFVHDAGEVRVSDAGGTVRLPSVEELARGVLAGDRGALARAISWIEAVGGRHSARAEELLARVLPRAGGAIRVGVTGVPGAGKSTFIERLGLHLCEQGRRVAVLAIDPSSSVSGGSILGDRTRMARLSTHALAFIRPSPSGCVLGGVARRTREAGLVCEAAGYEVVLIETVGVGQSETVVADMVDCVLTLALPGAGDELQGVKRGLLELVDVIAVNKADGDNLPRARRAAQELDSALRVLRGGRAQVAVLTCSAATGEGIAPVWEAVETHVRGLRADGRLEAKRAHQQERWLDALLDERLRAMLEASAAVSAALAEARAKVRTLTWTPAMAAERVLGALRAEVRGQAVVAPGAESSHESRTTGKAE